MREINNKLIYTGYIYKDNKLLDDTATLLYVDDNHYIWIGSVNIKMDSLIYRISSKDSVITTDQNESIYLDKDSIEPYYDKVCSNKKLVKELNKKDVI